MGSAADAVTGSAEDPEDHSDDQQDDADRGQHRDTEQDPEEGEDDSEDDHERPTTRRPVTRNTDDHMHVRWAGMWIRLRQVALVAHALEPVVDEFQRELDVAVAYRDPAVAMFGLHNAVMPVGNQFVEVVAPVRDDTAAGRYLERRNGDGGYMVILQCSEHDRRRERVKELGVRTAFEHVGDEYHIMQLHPADTGGSFLEIDEQVGGESLDGPWEPAGAEWQRARRTNRVRGIVAAELQSPDPERLAARWSDIFELPVDSVDGATTIRLDGAGLRFVEATDGRGEGLGGIDVLLAPHAAAPEVDTIGGVRLRFVADDATSAAMSPNGPSVAIDGRRERG